MSTLVDFTDVIASPENKVIRVYAIEPTQRSVNGHNAALPEPCEVALRYQEADIVSLHRDSTEAAAEALRFARKRGVFPAGVDATVTCTRETLRRA